MREYIVNLTNNLIGEHQFDSMTVNFDKEDAFVAQAMNELLVQNVGRMSYETLGRIMCEFDGQDIWPGIRIACLFFPDRACDVEMRKIVSNALAQCIWNRLSGRIDPAYTRRGSRKATIGSLAGKQTQKVCTTKDAVRLALSTGLADDTKGVMPEVLAYLKQHPDQIMEYGMQIQDAYSVNDRRTPIVKIALTLQSALK